MIRSIWTTRLRGAAATALVTLAAGATACGPKPTAGRGAPGDTSTASPSSAVSGATDSGAAPSDSPAGAGSETELGKPVLVVEGLRTPESVAVGPDGRYYVSLIGEFGKPDGGVTVVDPATGAKTAYASGLVDPKGLAFKGDVLYAADADGVKRIAQGGKVSVFAPASAFPRKPQFLNDLVFDAAGDLLVSDSGDLKSGGGAVFRIEPDGKVSLLAGSDSIPDVTTANGLASGPDGIYVVSAGTGGLFVTDERGEWRKAGDGFGNGDGLAFDRSGRMFVTDNSGGNVYLANGGRPLSGPAARPERIAGGLKGPADLFVDEARGRLLVPELAGGRLDVYKLP